jgi:very-short-patch-repair endonuclease
MLHYDPKLKPLSRELGKKSTLAEVLLWNHLKGSKMLGLGFLRQKPIDKYIVDFYCPKLKLVVEIDGSSHRGKFESDQTRESDLKAPGLHVLRFTDKKGKQDMSNVLWVIQCWIEQQLKKGGGTSP